ncbi:hypothetical protein [Roseisolibacter agri]|uniref:Uncharacterized protein n=1 Tax=Roseisolibacter agri TaxID=2014610 RepID=A0AA37VG82_9BACT|nr:hypothetical protein [Roseisolibacter agri]GLC28094.1 hypothetical protein rosag_46070 [Roseisolibacter agri]
MEARSVPAALAPAARAADRAVAVPWPLVATVFAATSIVLGLIWDISWHMTIGRDTFWTPAHMGVYLGGIVGGCANGWLVLRTTFGGSDADRARSVRFWGFRGPLGAFVSIWGAGAMLTSAPFDDWWHGAYGLDVEILSPPHVVLLLGVLGIVGGAMITSLTYQNAAAAAGASDEGQRLYRLCYAYAAGLLLTMAATAVYEYTHPIRSHSATFYKAAAYAIPPVLVAAARGSRLRWPATATALMYMGVFCAMTWILPLFPATPKLGPIYQDITHMVPMGFPLLLVVPALAMDVILRRTPDRSRLLLALLIGIAFVATLLAVHWPFGTFMMSKASHNWFFAGDNFTYNTPKTSMRYRGEFPQFHRTPAELWTGLAMATGIAVVTTWIGLAWGDWMRRVRR